ACGPMSRHHWMYFGCQCSSARCSRLLLERPTLFGIFSAEIIDLLSQKQYHGGHGGNTEVTDMSYTKDSVSSPSAVSSVVGFLHVRFQSNSGLPCCPYTLSA